MSKPIVIGKVIPQMKGEYDPNYNYDILDEVQGGVSMYRSKRSNNQGHPLTDTDWWIKTFDAGAAIDEATRNNQATPNDHPVEIARLVAIGTDGQVYSITPESLVQYVIEQMSAYNFICTSR